jgi:NADH-quinone oxidoreductase subunit L
MSTPLILLAIPTVIAGFWGIDAVLNRKFGIEAGHAVGLMGRMFAPFSHAPFAAVAGLGAILVGFSAAFALYWNAERDPLPLKMTALSRAMRNRFYFDEIYETFIDLTQELLAGFAAAFDRWIIAGLLVRGLSGTTDLAGRALRLFQTGNLQTYAFLLVAGAALLLFYVFTR